MNEPIVANWIRFKRISAEKYEIINLLHDEKIEANSYIIWFIQQLSKNKNPYLIDKRNSKEAVDYILNELEEEYIIRDKRFLSKHFLYLLITVWRPRITQKLKFVACIINKLLLVLFLPFLVFSIYFFVNNFSDLSGDYITIGSIFGLLVGIFLHELGHMFACIAYGGEVFEVGVMLQFFLPGAYVLMNKNRIKNRMKRIQIIAAGIEMNLLLAAICLIFAAEIEWLSGFFFGACIQNIFLALINLTFINGFDGMTIISELLGIEGLADRATTIIKSSWKKNKLRKYGVSGKAVVVVCYIVKGVQIALPLIFALNIMGVVSWFI